MPTLRFLLLLAVAAAPAVAQDVPTVVRDGIAAKTPGLCWEQAAISRDSVPYWPALLVFVGRCSTYFGRPYSTAVALDSKGVFYLLDSEVSLAMLEHRLGRPALDSTTILQYAFDASRLAGAVEWDAQLVRDPAHHPNPAQLAPTFPTHGSCAANRPWVHQGQHGFFDAGFDAATPWSIVHVREFIVIGGQLAVQTTEICSAMHNP